MPVSCMLPIISSVHKDMCLCMCTLFISLCAKFYLILPVALGSGVYSASNRNEYQKYKVLMFLESKVRQVCRVDNLTTIYEPIV
jgi:hypothetical protein